ncbi:MAG: hypothetical protein ACKVQB_09620, partial [Bacteroidia bacterium]
GLYVANSTIDFTYGTLLQTHTVIGHLRYDATNQSVILKEIEYGDTAKPISGLIHTNEDRYVGYYLDPNNFIRDSISQIRIFKITLLHLDNKFNTIDERRLTVGSINYDIFGFRDGDYTNNLLKTLNNGHFIISTAEGNLWSKNYLICFDENLNTKWKIKIENTNSLKDDYYLKDIMVTKDAIYVLQNKINYDGTFDHYRIKKYDYDGNLLNTSASSVSGAEARQIISSPSGYLVVGAQYNALTDSKIFFSSFDINNNHVATKLLNSMYDSYGTQTFIQTNILECNNAWYFMSGSQLVKVNKIMETEWVKPIAMPGYQAKEGFLVNAGENITFINKLYWLGISGMAFTKIDFDGEVVK